uniref:Uncharacterized protein n=1 Tax=Nelumbo nucifera TaxID=4432 RepID=A0A822ZR96_NELNU|nr:TPA_asm: hypothetical protein HUJ06_017330 [Nelumbo nucifera]
MGGVNDDLKNRKKKTKPFLQVISNSSFAFHLGIV